MVMDSWHHHYFFYYAANGQTKGVYLKRICNLFRIKQKTENRPLLPNPLSALYREILLRCARILRLELPSES